MYGSQNKQRLFPFTAAAFYNRNLNLKPFNAELNLICHLLALLGAHRILHVSRIRVKAQWLLYVPPGLTFNNSTFCPHSVFMCYEGLGV